MMKSLQNPIRLIYMLNLGKPFQARASMRWSMRRELEGLVLFIDFHDRFRGNIVVP